MSRCADCRKKTAITLYKLKSTRVWNGEDVLFSDAEDRYFLSLDSLADYLCISGKSIEDLRLVICKKVYYTELDPGYFSDGLAEESELPGDISHAIESLNKAIKNEDHHSWLPGKYAAKFTPEQREYLCPEE